MFTNQLENIFKNISEGILTALATAGKRARKGRVILHSGTYANQNNFVYVLDEQRYALVNNDIGGVVQRGVVWV